MRCGIRACAEVKRLRRARGKPSRRSTPSDKISSESLSSAPPPPCPLGGVGPELEEALVKLTVTCAFAAGGAPVQVIP